MDNNAQETREQYSTQACWLEQFLNSARLYTCRYVTLYSVYDKDTDRLCTSFQIFFLKR